MIKDGSVQSVLEAASIVDVISGYTSLRKRGITYSGLCPFHQEKTPSFSVNADKGLYYCFGCGEGGDVVRFLERMENLSFTEVIEQLAERYNIKLEYEETGGPDTGKRDRDARLLQLLDKAAKFYQRYLWESQAGQGARRVSREARAGPGDMRDVPRGVVARPVAGAAREGREGRVHRPRTGRSGSADPPDGQDVRSLPRASDVSAGGPPGQSGGVRREDAQGREPQVPQLPRGPAVPEEPAPLRAVSRRGARSRRRTRSWWWRGTRT